MKRKRFVKLLMGLLLLTRNEANYVADTARISNDLERRWRLDNGRNFDKI